MPPLYIDEYFDVYNPMHLRIFYTYLSTGKWDLTFPPHIRYYMGWIEDVKQKIIYAWIYEKLAKAEEAITLKGCGHV